MKKFLCSVVVLLVAGCAGVPRTAPAYSRAPDAPPGRANVYIYRIGAYPTMRIPTISIDGKVIFGPPEGSYTVVALPEGKHEFKVNWGWDTGWPDLDFPFSVESSARYLKLSGSYSPRGDGGFEAGSFAQWMNQSVAEPEMTKCCRYLAQKK